MTSAHDSELAYLCLSLLKFAGWRFKTMSWSVVVVVGNGEHTRIHTPTDTSHSESEREWDENKQKVNNTQRFMRSIPIWGKSQQQIEKSETEKQQMKKENAKKSDALCIWLKSNWMELKGPQFDSSNHFSFSLPIDVYESSRFFLSGIQIPKNTQYTNRHPNRLYRSQFTLAENRIQINARNR